MSSNVLGQTLRSSKCVAQKAFFATAPSSDMLRFRSPVLQTNTTKLARYGGRHNVAVLPGDGIGPEMIHHVERILAAVQAPIDFEIVNLTSSEDASEDLAEAITAIQRNGVALKGNIETKFDNPSFISRNMELRRHLNLYANVLHCATIPTIPSRHTGIDMVIIRENTEGEYSGNEHEATSKPRVVESLKIVTREKSEQITRFAFQFAKKYGRKKVTAVHKANIQKMGDGLFLKIAGEIAKNEYPDIEFNAMIVDNASMQLVSRPQQFDVMLMPNLYGNIISNIACGLVGGPGLVSGMNIGDDYAVFETGTRNTGTTLAGKDLANPTAFIRAAVDMLRFLGLQTHADVISDSLFRTLVDKKIHTADIGGTAKSSELVATVLEFIEKEMDDRNYRV
uniref:Isocitrate dehydrogenase [NAD] subunit, mitochondrial n=1 Tax=Caenorhabditis japonica TaxID=281687 RepID=A0A8R1DTN6_CAEJA